MDLEVPHWLDKAFLTAALQGEYSEEPNLTVLDFSVSRAVPAGVNYISNMFRVKVHYRKGTKEERVSLIIKAPITEGKVTELTQNGNHYGKECNFYTKIMPVMTNLLKCEVAPLHFYSSVDDVLVLEDLKEKGYVMCDRHKQLDFSHCQRVMETMAKFHAASVACKRDYPNILAVVSKESLYCENTNFEKETKPWIEESVLAVADVVKDMGLGNSAEEMFRSKANTAAEVMIEILKPKPFGLNVLNHGDVSVNNVLFKYTESGSVEDVKLLDFQLTRYTSPAADLLYFIWSSADEQVRDSRLPELCEMYRLTLNSTLKQLGCEERLSQEEFRQDFKDTIPLAVINVGHIWPIIISDKRTGQESKENKTLIDAFGGKEFLFNGKYFRKYLPKMIEHLQSWISHYK